MQCLLVGVTLSFVTLGKWNCITNILYPDVLIQTRQRPFFTPQMQQVRPRWQPTHPQQQVRPSGIEGIPGGGKVSGARSIRQVPPRGAPGQQPQPTEPGGASQRLGMGQPHQVRRRPGGMQAQRQPFKFGQNVRKQPEGHPGTVAMQSQDPVQQAIHIPVSIHIPSRLLWQIWNLQVWRWMV